MFISKVEEFFEFEVKINVNLSPPGQRGGGGVGMGTLRHSADTQMCYTVTSHQINHVYTNCPQGAAVHQQLLCSIHLTFFFLCGLWSRGVVDLTPVCCR